jgi:hypothetical protein
MAPTTEHAADPKGTADGCGDSLRERPHRRHALRGIALMPKRTSLLLLSTCLIGSFDAVICLSTASAQTLSSARPPLCGTVTENVIKALAGRRSGGTMSYIEFEGACVRGSVDCSSPRGIALSILTTCLLPSPSIQAAMAQAMQSITGSNSTVDRFVSKCIAARTGRKSLPTDQEVGKAIVICTESESFIELRAEPSN